MEAERRTNRHPEVSSERSRNHYRNAMTPWQQFKGRCCSRPKMAGVTSDYPKQSINRKAWDKMETGVSLNHHPSVKMNGCRNHYRNACPIHQKKEKNNRTDRGWWSQLSWLERLIVAWLFAIEAVFWLRFGYDWLRLAAEIPEKTRKNRRQQQGIKTTETTLEVLNNQIFGFKKKWGGKRDLNPRPPGPQGLTTEPDASVLGKIR